MFRIWVHAARYDEMLLVTKAHNINDTLSQKLSSTRGKIFDLAWRYFGSEFLKDKKEADLDTMPSDIPSINKFRMWMQKHKKKLNLSISHKKWQGKNPKTDRVKIAWILYGNKYKALQKITKRDITRYIQYLGVRPAGQGIKSEY